MARPLKFDHKLILRVASSMSDRIRAIAPDEDLATFIREATEKELRRRERPARAPRPPT